MLKKLSAVGPLMLLTVLGALNASAQDCFFPFTLTSAQATGAYNNKQLGCVNWQMFYFNAGFSAVSIQFESAPDTLNGAGTFGVFAGTVIGTGSNPSTSTTQAAVAFSGGAGTTIYPWVRVNLTSVTGTGTITGAVIGTRVSTPSGFPSFAGSAGGVCGQYPSIMPCLSPSGYTFTRVNSGNHDTETVRTNGSQYFHVLGNNATGDTVINYLFEQNYPAGCPPCSFTWTWDYWSVNANNLMGGYFRDHTGKHMTAISYEASTTCCTDFWIMHHNADPTTSNTLTFINGWVVQHPQPVALRLIDDGTNIFACTSTDGGQTFFKPRVETPAPSTILSEARNSFVATIDRVGFWYYLSNGNYGIDLSLLSYTTNLSWVADANGC